MLNPRPEAPNRNPTPYRPTMALRMGSGKSTSALAECSLHAVYFRWTPHPVIVTIMDNKDYFGVLLYSYYTTITGWGGSS